MTFTGSALALLKKLEGCRLDAYRDQAGIWTIGYGETAHVSPGMSWTQEQADTIIAARAEEFANGVRALLHPPVPLNDNEFSALVIFAYNVGLHALGGSTVLRHINGGIYSSVPTDLAQWDKIHLPDGRLVVDAGLQKRRAAEVALWNSDPLP